MILVMTLGMNDEFFNEISGDSVSQLFDFSLALKRRVRAERRGVENFLLEHAREDLFSRLQPVLRAFENILDFGTPDAIFSTALQGAFPNATHQSIAPRGIFQPLAPAHYNLIVSGGVLQFVNDLPKTLIQLRQALKPDGLFIAMLPGGDTLIELRQALLQAEEEVTGGIAPRVGPFVEIRDFGSLLQRAGFALPVTDSERLTLRYDSMFALIKDLRSMGVSNPLTIALRQPLNRQVILRAAEIYAELFSDADGRVRATIDLLWASAWAPHENQQKPLKPGSAKMSLAEGLARARTRLEPK